MIKLVRYYVAGTILQAMCLVAYIVISRSCFPVSGKPIVIFCSIICMLVFIWQGVNHMPSKGGLLLLPVFLALGYSIAFHLVGLMFRGLLRDVNLSMEYMESVLAVTGVMLLLYAICTLLLYLLKQRMRPSCSDAQS